MLQKGLLEELLSFVCARHQVHFDTVRVGGHAVDCLQFSDMNAYIDQQVDRPGAQPRVNALPLWAKIWPASLPLALYMLHLTPRKTDHVLEIGAGLGLAGLFAARRGFTVVVSDIIPEALLFARINALRNQLADNIQVLAIDFLQDAHPHKYSHIIGSEVLYSEQFFVPLLSFLINHIENDFQCEILLSADSSRYSSRFFAAAKNHFQIARKAIPYQHDCTVTAEESGDAGLETQKDKTIFLYRMRPQ
jgi:predicted nicotinamide N-methyase